MEFPRKNSEKSWMKYIYFSLYSLLLSSCFTFWMKSSVYIWIEISLLQSVHNVASWLDPPTITFFKKFIYIAGKFFKTCNFAQIVSIFCLLVFRAQFLKVVCGLIVDLFGHRFKQFFQKHRFCTALNSVPTFFKGIHFRLILGKVEVWKNREDFSFSNPDLWP